MLPDQSVPFDQDLCNSLLAVDEEQRNRKFLINEGFLKQYNLLSSSRTFPADAFGKKNAINLSPVKKSLKKGVSGVSDGSEASSSGRAISVKKTAVKHPKRKGSKISTALHGEGGSLVEGASRGDVSVIPSKTAPEQFREAERLDDIIEISAESLGGGRNSPKGDQEEDGSEALKELNLSALTGGLVQGKVVI